MFRGIPTTSTLFTKDVIMETNAAFSQLFDIAEKFKAPNLQPHYESSAVFTFVTKDVINGKELVPQSDQSYRDTTAKVSIDNTNCFNIGHETWIQLAVSFDNDINIQDAQKIVTLSVSSQNSIFYSAVPKSGKDIENLRGYLKGSEIFIQGIAKKNIVYIISFSFARGV